MKSSIVILSHLGTKTKTTAKYMDSPSYKNI